MVAVPRMRVIAGPNGSGKTTILSELQDDWIGVYVNADEIEKTLRTAGTLDLASFEIAADPSLAGRLTAFYLESTLLKKIGANETVAAAVSVDGTAVDLAPALVNSYVAAALADFLRRELLRSDATFTFETVMSSDDKIDFMWEALDRGYRTYLYFVATDSADINIDRVKQRVKEGGHPVPEDRIRDRYQKSIGLLADACAAAKRAYIFDNSGDQHFLVAETDEDGQMTVHSQSLPHWFTASSLWEAYSSP